MGQVHGPSDARLLEVRWSIRWVTATLAVAFALVCAASTSAAAPACPPPPDPQPAIADTTAPPPDALIACIAARPVAGELFSHWFQAARKGDGPGAPDDQVASEVMQFLVSAFWLEGEAAERHIHISDRTVTRTLNRQRRESFRTKRAYRHFLRSSGMTRSDLKYRVRLDMLSNHIRRQVLRGHKTAASQQRALNNFVTHFRNSWQAKTWCRSDYAIEDCGATG